MRPGRRGPRLAGEKEKATEAECFRGFFKDASNRKSDQPPQARGCIVLTRLVNRDTLRLAFFLWIEPLEAVL